MMGVNSRKPGINRWQELLVEFSLMLLMCTSLVYLFVSALGLGQSIFTIILINLICLGVWTAAFANRRTVIISFVLVLLAASITAYIYFVRNSSGAVTEVQSKMDAFLYWASSYLKGYRVESLPYKKFLTVILSALFSLAISFFTVRKFDLVAAITPGAVCFVVLFIIGHTISMPSLFCFILAATLYFLLHSYKKNAGEMLSGEAPKPLLFMASALPLALLVLTITIVVSSLVKLDPGWMKDIRDKILKKDNKVNEYIINNADIPVISTAELGGNIVLGDTVVMEVTSPVSSVYLRGISKDVYTGHSWTQSDTTPSAFSPSTGEPEDTRETGSSLGFGFLLAGEGNSNLPLLQDHMINIKYKNFSTGTIYVPLKTISVDNISHPMQINQIGADAYMLQKSIAPTDFQYTVRFNSIQKDKPEFIEFIKNWFAGKYSDQFAQNINTDDADISARVYSNRNYMDLPSSLPSRVKDLALDITKNAVNDYEKAKAIEQYFASNDFAYTLAPGSYDKSKDFTDQFLFVNKKGYCTYYATAMAVLLRCVGIPSRYVEGYVLPAKEQDSDVYEVTKRQGHAWVEAYFKGLGWLQFEPTIAYSNGARPANTPEPTATPKPTPTHTPTKSAAPEDNEDKPAATGALKINLLLPLLILFFTALLASLLYIPYQTSRKMLKLQPKDAALLLYEQYMDLLSVQRIALGSSETAALFARRVDGLLGLSKHGLKRASEIFQLARYSDHEVTDDHKQQMLVFRKELLAASRKKLGLVRYLYFKWLWMS